MTSMWRAVAGIGTLILAVACTSATPAPPESPSSSSEGQNCETAVLIDAPNEREGIAAEYEWIARRFPGYRRLGQSLGACKGFRSDVVNIETAAGEKRSIVFNIESFFGKW